MNQIEIIYEDSSCIVCHKVAGVPVQSRNIRVKDMESMLRAYVKKTGGTSAEIYVVHRLDQPVEGVIVFAKTKEAAADLSRQFQSGLAGKQYLAVVEGAFEEAVQLEDYLYKDGKSNSSKVVAKETKGAKRALLRLEPVKQVGDRQLVKVFLQTGRHHQIRVQLSHAGHPIVGDAKYNEAYRQQKGFVQTGLCSVWLDFVHPESKEAKHFEIIPRGEIFSPFL